MSKPTNSAHRNAMNDYERKIYDMGWAEAEASIIRLLKADCEDGIGDNLQGCFHQVAVALIEGETA